VIGGGEKRNTVPGCADAYIDMRFPTRDGGESLRQGIKTIAQKQHTSSSKYPGVPATEFWAVLHRPVKPKHPAPGIQVAALMALSPKALACRPWTA